MGAGSISKSVIDRIVSAHEKKPGNVLSILEEIQRHNPQQYLPRETLSYVSERIRMPLARLYSIATFYAFFNLKPQGKHTIVVCRGTACHTRRSKQILDFLIDTFNLDSNEVKDGEKFFLTTQDNQFTVRTVACFGQCALAPVVEIDGVIYSNMTVEKLKRVLRAMRKAKKIIERKQ